MRWTNYVHLLYRLCTDIDVFGADPYGAIETIGAALDRTHSEMTKADEFFVQNVIGHYREQLDLIPITLKRPS